MRRRNPIMKKPRRRLTDCLAVFALLVLASGCARGGDSEALLRDDFGNPRSGWGVDQREQFERGYGEGEYFIELHAPNWFAWAYPGERFDDVSVETDAHLSSGPPDGHFGVICRHVDPGNFYYFAVSADGYYAIFRRMDGGNLDVLTTDGRGMAPSPSIRTDGQLNHVQATCQGSELSLYVNGELLETVTDDAHRRGDVGVGAGSGPVGDVLIRFDDFLVTTP